MLTLFVDVAFVVADAAFVFTDAAFVIFDVEVVDVAFVANVAFVVADVVCCC